MYEKMEKKTIPLWQDLLFWGTIISLLVREYNYKYDYYVLSGLAVLFMLFSFLDGRKLYIREFLRKYWYVVAVMVLCLIYQALRAGLTRRMLSRTSGIGLLVYAGFLYGKRFAGQLVRSSIRLAVFLGAAGAIGLVWWALRICPLGFTSGLAVKYFLSAPERMVSVFSHPILAACYMLLLISLTMFFWPDHRYLPLRMALLLIGLTGLFATVTRSAYLVFAFVVFLWILSFREKLRGLLSGKIIALGVAAVIVICAVLLYSGAFSYAFERFFGTDWRADRSYTLRIDSMSIIMGSVLSRGIGRFLFGSGIGKGKNVLDVAWFQEKYGKKLIDNTYLTTFADQGIFMAGLLLAEALYVLICCFRERCASLHGKVCHILLPQMLMIAVFDVQGWCSLLFVVCVLAGMEMAVREPRGRALTEREGI